MSAAATEAARTTRRPALTVVSAEPNPPDVGRISDLIEKYLSADRERTRLRWELADQLAEAERDYAGKYPRWARRLRVTPHTLHNWASVARSIPHAVRRDGLSWSHHDAVAGLDPADQARLLGEAERERLAVPELRRRAKRQRDGRPSAFPTIEPEQPRFKCPGCDHECGGRRP